MSHLPDDNHDRAEAAFSLLTAAIVVTVGLMAGHALASWVLQ